MRLLCAAEVRKQENFTKVQILLLKYTHICYNYIHLRRLGYGKHRFAILPGDYMYMILYDHKH